MIIKQYKITLSVNLTERVFVCQKRYVLKKYLIKNKRNVGASLDLTAII